MPNNPFTDAVEALIKLALDRCAANPQSEQMQLQVRDLRNCLAREEKAEHELKAKAEFAARIDAREKKTQTSLAAKVAAHEKETAEQAAADQARVKKADDELKAKIARHERESTAAIVPARNEPPKDAPVAPAEADH
ncbi:MAG: hypothetical protein FD161_2975 [Limisphaerales bacterium]|nr:MAG: hypothetical protein FD161_2975 [Limisphaerales bacterium]KAG0508088.1 MAG: hypothetical protein E1N63_2682 [Limisphaerales bacterium]TXT53059.1 MAG: hypothetical protein FD140_167 [Limisphaerales bacterium]